MIPDWGFENVDKDGWVRDHKWIGKLVVIGKGGTKPARIVAFSVEYGPHGETWPDRFRVRYIESGRHRTVKRGLGQIREISPLEALALQA